MADRKHILSKRSLRRHVKKNTDSAMAKLHNCTTYLEPSTKLSPAVSVSSESDTDSECEEEWFMATDSENMSATSGQEDVDMTDDYCSLDETEGEGDSDSDIDFIDDSNLRDDLKVWAVTTNTPISHLSSLLSVLLKHFPNVNLPKDGRTLLSTPTYTQVQSKAGGSMHYFGVANGVRARLDNGGIGLLGIKSQTLHLQINVDGLPLFKSTNQQ